MWQIVLKNSNIKWSLGFYTRLLYIIFFSLEVYLQKTFDTEHSLEYLWDAK